MNINGVYHGFRLLEQQDIEEINSKASLFEHQKTKARLIHLDNEDINRFFNITFRTPPNGDHGICHILEHSVLNGSRKFPLREPFVELLKGSLSTFVNAMTYPDKTMYPVASTNEKDFFNLMDVYLDAVFYPNIYKKKEIFLQEGWHYHLESATDEITYKGVVYNEMKGAFSSPETILTRYTMSALFPDSIYGWESGGDPVYIPTLNYQQFLDFHKKYYHPSNSFIILYGQGDLNKRLEFLNEKYLQDFDYQEIDSTIKTQKKLKNIQDKDYFYPIATGENPLEKTYLNYSIAMDEDLSAEDNLALNIITDILMESQSAPLKQALLDNNIGKDVFGYYLSDAASPVLFVIAKNAREDQKQQFLEVIEKTLSDLVRDGLDPKLIKSVISREEFSLREADFRNVPKGLVYSGMILESWLYDKDPFINLRFNTYFKNIKEKSKHGYLESLIEKYFLNNTHKSLISLRPQPGLENENNKILQKELMDYKKSLTSDEISDLLEMNKKLKDFQLQKDTKEALQSIPTLNLEDINKKAQEIPQNIAEMDNFTFLKHPIFTNKIIYLDLFFDSLTIKKEDIPYLQLLSSLLAKLSTENYQYSDLDNEIGIHLGDIDFSVTCPSNKNNADRIFPKFLIKSKAMIDKLDKMCELIEEILLKTIFDNKKRIKEILQEIKSRQEMHIMEAGHSLGMIRVNSHMSVAGSYIEQVKGISYFKFINNLLDNFEQNYQGLINKLERIQKQIFSQKNLLISITTDKESMEEVTQQVEALVCKFSQEEIPHEKYTINNNSNHKEGFYIPGQVQYVSKGSNFSQYGFEYNGHLSVVKKIITLTHLWNKVRAQGGAYGSFMNISNQGMLTFSSYRDPNLKKTLEIYNNTAQFLKDYQTDNHELKKSIIGTISELEQVLSPAMKGAVMASRYISEMTQEEVQQNREEVLKTTLKDINKAGELLEKSLEKDYICVIGSESEIKKHKDLFDHIEGLL